MNTYNLRKNYTAFISDHDKLIRAKLAFKTKETLWEKTEAPVIVFVSIHSAFHNDLVGDLKMNAFISTIKSNVRGKVTILLTENAHINALSLKCQNNLQKAFEECLKDANNLCKRYFYYFEGCHVAFWHSFICQNENYDASLKIVNDLYQSDEVFRNNLKEDAENSYTNQRNDEFSNKALFIRKTIIDLTEQCACLLVLAKMGYRFLFYPGKPYTCTEYLMQVILPKNEQILWVDVFLAIEKKSIHSI